MTATSPRQILLSGAFLWMFAVVGTTLVALTEFSSRDAIVENERQLLLRNLYALLPADKLDNDIASDRLQLPASALLGEGDFDLQRVLLDVRLRAYKQYLSG